VLGGIVGCMSEQTVISTHRGTDDRANAVQGAPMGHGFVAGPNQSESDPLGVGGEPLHRGSCRWGVPRHPYR
jgi:hypothetical protein